VTTAHPDPDLPLRSLAAATTNLTPADLRRLRIEQPYLYEQFCEQMERFDRLLILDLAKRIAAGQLPAANVEEYLVDTLHLTPDEAAERVAAAVAARSAHRLAS